MIFDPLVKIYFIPKTICKNLWCGAITGKGRPGPAYSCLLVFGTKPNNVRHSEYMPSASYLDVTLTNTPLYSFLAGISVVKDRTLPLWNLKFLPNCCLFIDLDFAVWNKTQPIDLNHQNNLESLFLPWYHLKLNNSMLSFTGKSLNQRVSIDIMELIKERHREQTVVSVVTYRRGVDLLQWISPILVSFLSHLSSKHLFFTTKKLFW